MVQSHKGNFYGTEVTRPDMNEHSPVAAEFEEDSYDYQQNQNYHHAVLSSVCVFESFFYLS